MIDSRSKTLAAGLAAALAVAAFLQPPLFMPASAQQGPRQLTPPVRTREAPAAIEVAPAAAPTILQLPIAVGTLAAVDIDSSGTLTKDGGGFGIDMWAGTGRDLVDRMLPILPVRVTSPAMRDIMRRLLLSIARAPDGDGKPGDLMTMRVKALAAMGDIAAVDALLQAAPTRGENDALLRLEADILFLRNDNGRACPLVTGQIRGSVAAFWQKAFIFCQSLAGEHDKASLGVDLLRETGEDDAVFFGLIDALRGLEKFEIDSLASPKPLHLAMVRAARVRLPADVTSTDDPGILRTIATSPNARPPLRLDAGERAEAMGALSTEVLRQLYTGITFAEGALNNPLSRAENDRSPFSRALLYRKALVEAVPTALATVLSRALELARDGGRYQAAARIYKRILTGLVPTQDLVWFAPEAIRALLAAKDDNAAKAWFGLLRASAIFEPESKDNRAKLLPLARLTGAEETLNWSDDDLTAWWAGQRKPTKAAASEKRENGAAGDPPAETQVITPAIDEEAVARAVLLYNLLEATGDKVPDRLWNELLVGSPQRTSVMPRPALWRALGEAGKAGRVGETVMLSLLALGQAGPAAADPLTLRRVVANLMKVGLEADARAVAVEAAVAAGL